jgi:hypothetical protein
MEVVVDLPLALMLATMDAEDSPQLLDAIQALVVNDRTYLSDESVILPFDQRIEQFVLGSEVPVEGAFGYADPLDDRVHRGGFDPSRAEELRGGIHDLFTARMRLFESSHPHLTSTRVDRSGWPIVPVLYQ